MRQLLPNGHGHHADPLTEDDLRAAYAFPDRPWLRANFVSTLDGAATGPNGRTGTINNAADQQVFALQRDLCDAVVVGAETARIEGYRRIEGEKAPLLVVLSSSAQVPPGIVEPASGRGRVVLVVSRAAPAASVERAQDLLGEDAVWAAGDSLVDLVAVRERLVEHGHHSILAEGGPTLFAAMLASRVVDEVALTWVPNLIAGDHPRITSGVGELDITLTPASLIEDEGTILGLWRVAEAAA